MLREIATHSSLTECQPKGLSLRENECAASPGWPGWSDTRGGRLWIEAMPGCSDRWWPTARPACTVSSKGASEGTRRFTGQSSGQAKGNCTRDKAFFAFILFVLSTRDALATRAFSAFTESSKETLDQLLLLLWGESCFWMER